MAVVGTGRGHDASDPFKTTGASEGPVITLQCGAGNYLSALQKGGEPAGTRRFGFEWAYQPVSKGRVITGFSEKAMDRSSSRRAQITKTALVLADQDGKDRGHAPDQRALAGMRRFANAMTRRAKEPGTQHHAQAPPQERVVRHAQNSRRRQRGSRRAENSRMRANAWPWRPACYRARRGERYATRAQLPVEEQLFGGAIRGRALSRARPVRCAARRGLRASTDAATRGRGWRLDGRSG